jgi:ATP-dependent Clp protease protease subunit
MTQRQVRLGEKLTLATAQTAAEKLFKFDASGNEPILLLIGTREGFAPAAMVVVDAIAAVRSKVYAVIQSEAFGPGAVVALFCDRRYAFPHASLLFNKLAYESEKIMKEKPPLPVEAANAYLERINKKVAKKIRLTFKEFNKRSEKGWFLTAQQAKKQGLIDEIVERVQWVELVVETVEIKRSSTIKEKRRLPSPR